MSSKAKTSAERAAEWFADLTAGREDRRAVLAEMGLGETEFYNTASRLAEQLHACRGEHHDDGEALDRIVAADLMLFGLLLGTELARAAAGPGANREQTSPSPPVDAEPEHTSRGQGE